MKKNKMSKELRRAHIKFAKEMLGESGVVSLICVIPLAIFGKIQLAFMCLFYASLRYHMSWNHDDLKDRLRKRKNEKK